MKCCYRSVLRMLVLCKKWKLKNLNSRWLLKKKTSFGTLTVHLLVELWQKVHISIIYRNFHCMDFTSSKGLPQLETPVIIRQARRWRHETQSPPKERPAETFQTQLNLQPAMLDLSTKPCDMKLKNWLVDVVQQVATSGNFLNGIEPSSIFVKQHSLAFIMLNGIFQHSTLHDTWFNIFWTAVATLFCCSTNVELCVIFLTLRVRYCKKLSSI